MNAAKLETLAGIASEHASACYRQRPPRLSFARALVAWAAHDCAHAILNGSENGARVYGRLAAGRAATLRALLGGAR